jgi:hypothetical protein
MNDNVSAPALLSETLLSLAQASEHLPPFRLGKRVTREAIKLWITRGIRLPDGERLRLEAVRIGGRWVTSLEALARFAERQTRAQGGPDNG